MNESFKSQSNYLVAFLAAVVGLGFLKNELSNINVEIFSYYPTLFNLAAIVVISLLLGAYIGARAHMVNSFNVTRVPLSGWLSSASSILSATALVLPIVFLIAACMTLLPFEKLKTPAASAITAIIPGIIGFFLGQKGIQNEKRQIAQVATTVIYPDNVGITLTNSSDTNVRVTNNKKTDDEKQFVMASYKSLLKFIADYLYVRGFGVKGENLVQLVQILADKGIMTASDLKRAQQITATRNRALHSNYVPSKVELGMAQDNILELFKKVQKAYLEYLGHGAGT